MVKYGERPLFNPLKVFFIGDVHGHLENLKLVWNQIEQLLTPEDHVVFLGDIINRGPNTPGVLLFIKELQDKFPNQIFVVRGNHECMLLDYVHGNTGWMTQPYAKITLEQMKIQWNLADVEVGTIKVALQDRGLLQLLTDTIPYYETPHCIGVHAPFDRTTLQIYGADDYEEYLEDEEITFKRYLLERIEYELRWNFANEEQEIPEIKKFWVCGHQFKHHKQPRLFKQRAYIDTGCGAKENRPLTCLVYPTKQIIKSDKQKEQA